MELPYRPENSKNMGMFGPEMNFLVAIPDPAKTETIARALSDEGYFNLTRVDDGLVAAELIRRNPDFFLIAAWDLPGVGGLELANEVRHSRSARHMPIILVGSPPTPQAMVQARELKVNGFCFGAGLSPDSLMEKVRKIMVTGGEEASRPESMEAEADELMKLGRVEEAVAMYRRIADETAKRTAALHGEIGILLLQKGETEAAVAELEQSVRDNPLMPRAQAALGQAYLDTGRPEDAAPVLEAAHRLDPQNEQVQAHLGESLLQAERFEKAEEVFQNLLDRNPHSMFYLNRLAIALRKQTKYTQALNLYLKALTIGREDENLHFNLGRCYFEAKRPDQAVPHLKKALEINPGFDEARLFLERIREEN